MRTRISLALVAIVAVGVAAAQQAQVTDPLPSIVKRGLGVEIRDVVRLPETRGLRPADQDVTPAGWARVSFVRDLPDGRRFVNDSRGFLYLLDREQQAVGLRERRRHRFRSPSTTGSRAASSASTSTPSSRSNGLFYTVHGERGAGNPATPNFIPPGFTRRRRDLPQRHHRVARDQSRGAHLRRARGASCCASPTSCRT